MSNSASVFDKDKFTITTTSVPEAGADNHISGAGSAASWSSKKNQELVQGSDPGQQQTLIKSADETLTIQKNQTTTVQEKIVIKSVGNEIYIEAATQITLIVGASKLFMNKDGTIELTGINIKINGTTITSQASGQHTIKGGRVDIN